MEHTFGFAIEAVVESLLNEDINQITATYKMLESKFPDEIKATPLDPNSAVYSDVSLNRRNTLVYDVLLLFLFLFFFFFFSSASTSSCSQACDSASSQEARKRSVLAFVYYVSVSNHFFYLRRCS